ncbi:MAG TPA: amino acid permease [Corynebacteriales bacterium]|nr:amino acid permease [Mycobacteriales bacterium]
MSSDPIPVSASAEEKKSGIKLGSGLKVRHLTMMGLGSAIGAGLFLGTGQAIQAAGPAVLLSYLMAGTIVVLVMQMLGELSAARPASGSFSEYTEMAFGRTSGFVMGWLYWFMLILVLGAEMTGAAAIMGKWFGVAPWIPGLVCMIFFTIVNLAQVQGFGEFEFWFAAIKVVVIILFLGLGALLIFGLLPGSEPVGFSNFLGRGGFMPKGWSGVAAGLLAVAFAFGGIEIVTIAAAESERPAQSVSKAVRSVIFRIFIFYIGSVLVITFLLPWDSLHGASDASESPFTKVLEQANLTGAPLFMEIVIVLSLLSAFNAQIYSSSRMMYSLAKRGHGPQFLTKLSVNKVPRRTLLISVFFGFVAVGLNYLELPGFLVFLLNSVGAILLVVWGSIAASQIKLRPQLEKEGPLTVKMWLYPYLSWAAIIMLIALTVLMLTDPTARMQVLGTLAVVVILTLLGLINKAWRKKHPVTGSTVVKTEETTD